ncbi:transposable element Tcb2 transposase [Trichonephila clavipes]|nr:transposable element Tcb2 transposase [Trichonephila clavipes]
MGIGAVLNQEQRPVVYASCMHSSEERNYTVTERECLVVEFLALIKFRTYLGSLPVKVIIEHAALTRLTNDKNVYSRKIRWVLKLAEFNIEWEHRPETQNAVADVLSRIPVERIVEQVNCAVMIHLVLSSRGQLIEEQRKDPEVGDIEKLFEETRQNTKAKNKKWAKYYDRRRRDVQIKVNDWVMVKTYPLSSAAQKIVVKFKPIFDGLYRVFEKKIPNKGNNDAKYQWLHLRPRGGAKVENDQAMRRGHNKENQFNPEEAERNSSTAPYAKEQRRIWNRFLETESAGQRPGQGRRWVTTTNENRYLVLTAQRHRNMNATLLQQHLRLATGTTVPTQTVRNRLHGVGLYALRPLSHFSVHPDNRRIFMWRDRGSRNNTAFVHESVRFGGGRVLVHGSISIDGRTDLYIIRDGPLTARRYRDEILRPIVVTYAAAIGDYFILIDDNSRPHRANSRKESNEWNSQRVLQT